MGDQTSGVKAGAIGAVSENIERVSSAFSNLSAKSGSKINLGIRGRLIAGFTAVGAVLVVAIGATVFEVGNVKTDVVRIDQLRVPTAFASGSLVQNIYASLADLRGWMLTGNSDFKKSRAAAWSKIDSARADMDELSKTWTNSKNLEIWAQTKTTLDEFKAAQARVEKIAHSADEQPATALLVTEAAPRAGVMVETITRLIELEATYETDVSKKTDLVSALRRDIGYGGMIHEFKNYVLRQDKPRVAKVTAKVDAAKEAIAAYRALGVNKAEKAALDGLSEVVNAYGKAQAEVQRLAKSGSTAENIDAAVKINDRPALDGLAVLDLEIGTAAVGKQRVLGALRDALGFGGMIHQFKNFVLRGDKARLKKVQAKTDAARRAIRRYKTFGLTETETKALADIERIINAYAAAASSVRELSDFGKSAKEIDGAVKINDSPAVKGLATLGEQIAVQAKDVAARATLKSRTENDRKQLLGMMADVRGTLGLSLANIRAYLLTGDAKFSDKFNKLWAKNEKRFADLMRSAYLLTPEQKKALDEFSSVRAEFAPLPAKMFEIRGSKKWNMANYLLVTEAAPRAGKLLTMLLGVKQTDGVRAGGMVDNQRALLSEDVGVAVGGIDFLSALVWVLLAVGIAISVIAVVLTSRSIVSPVTAMTAAMRRLADGDNEIDVPARERQDEIGQMAGAVQVFKDNAVETERLQTAAAKEQEAKDGQSQRVMDLCGTFDSTATEALDAVGAAADDMKRVAEDMTGAAAQTNDQALVVSSASEQATGNVQMVAAAAEELSASISDISRQVAQSADISGRAVAEAERTNVTVRGLAEAAQQIGDVVQMIDDIAEQTNLLALNATIEAARAGDAGKGFAVVASEVKSLSNETGKATEQIAKQITSIQGVTQDTVQAIEDIGKTIGEVSEIASAIAAAVEEQGAATQEIARNVQEAAQGTEQVSGNIEGVTKAAEESGHSAEKVLESAGQLAQQSESIRQQVDRFLSDIRAA